ncbi:MAG: hypothetical protein H3C62_02505 [Gemmatimonadaceae bacterium]|nr:hypothetical protein [Gemmatimonadaceae bacterium]
MYSTCLYCHAELGANEVVEHFPIGRRLAFDLANGRLWVICAACKRWNLTPVEERWEAIEECERLFEGTRLRMSTDNIGLARVAEGTELVRVGAAMRPELAAWRFGAQLAARRRQYRWLVAGGVVAIGGFYAGIAAVGASVGAFQGIWQLAQRGYERATRLVLPTPASSAADSNSPGWRWAAGIDRPQTEEEIARAAVHPRVETSHVRSTKLWLDPDDARLEVRAPVVGRRVAIYTGESAASVLPKLVAKLNRFGGKKVDERLAVDMLARVAEGGTHDLAGGVLRQYVGSGLGTRKLGEYGGATSLALEMALQEQRERELLAGELLELEAAWREAEELARIADTLTPSSIDAALARLKTRLQG